MKTQAHLPLSLSVKEAAALIGCSQRQVRQGVRDGTLPSYTLGKLIRLPRVALLRMHGIDATPNANGRTASREIVADNAVSRRNDTLRAQS
jgi:excisionase family DNA binding protein